MRLAALERFGVDEAIVGKALYEGRVTLAAAHEALALAGRALMLAKRLIPCLDVDRGRVVKGVRFVSLRDAGDPVEAAVRYDAAAPTSWSSSTSRRPRTRGRS